MKRISRNIIPFFIVAFLLPLFSFPVFAEEGSPYDVDWGDRTYAIVNNEFTWSYALSCEQFEIFDEWRETVNISSSAGFYYNSIDCLYIFTSVSKFEFGAVTGTGYTVDYNSDGTLKEIKSYSGTFYPSDSSVDAQWNDLSSSVFPDINNPNNVRLSQYLSYYDSSCTVTPTPTPTPTPTSTPTPTPTPTPTSTPTPTPTPPVSDSSIVLNFFLNNPEAGFLYNQRLILDYAEEWSNSVTVNYGYKFLYWVRASDGYIFDSQNLTGTAFNDQNYVAVLTKDLESTNTYLPDFNNLLANPAIASLVQEATSNYDTNFWYIDRTLYAYDEPVGCTVNGVVSVGYSEVFELYILNQSDYGFDLVSDSIGEVTTSIYNCSGTEQAGVLESSPFVREQVLTSFDLWSVPETDFYQILIDIYDLIASNPELGYLIQGNDYLSQLLDVYKNQSDTILNGNSSSQNSSNALNDTTSDLNDVATDFEQFESQFNSDLTSSLNRIDVNQVDFGSNADFSKTALWVKFRFDELVESSGIFGQVLTFSLIIGLFMLLVGRGGKE